MNRDPAVFEHPDELVLDRRPNRHAGFGLGIHRCLGSNFARAAFQAILLEVLRRLPDYRIDRASATRYSQASAVNGWGRMPATFTPGSRTMPEPTRPTTGNRGEEQCA
jgi:cytochrome P450